MPRDPMVSLLRPAAAAAALVYFGLISPFFLAVSAESSNNSQVRCSKSCVAENCDTIGIRYGKYCGVGWTGCPGEKPCDDLDACCKIHDECVEKKGLIDVKCHEKFKRCIRKYRNLGRSVFLETAPLIRLFLPWCGVWTWQLCSVSLVTLSWSFELAA